MLRNGGPWKDLPEHFASESTCRRRLREWTETGLLAEVWSRLVELSDELGWVEWDRLIADGIFCRAKQLGLSAMSQNGVNRSAAAASPSGRTAGSCAVRRLLAGGSSAPTAGCTTMAASACDKIGWEQCIWDGLNSPACSVF
jgi:hypothetical protein